MTTRRMRCFIASASLVLLAPWVVAASEIRCVTSWGGNGKVALLTADQINDGYCDCLDTGADETETSACAGMFQWAGLFPATTDDIQRKHAPNTFQCPQQPDLRIPASRVRDGVCDCCDGADESAGTANSTTLCSDQCAAIVAAAAAAKRDLEQRYRAGAAQRTAAVQAYTVFAAEAQAQLVEKRATAETKRHERTVHDTNLAEATQIYVGQRVERIQASVLPLATSDSGLLNGLSTNELEALLIHACQMAGEMAPKGSSAKTCVPLRLAALDMAAVWQAGDPYVFRHVWTAHSPLQAEAAATQTSGLLKVWRHNEENPDNVIWQESDVGNYRRNTSHRKQHKPRKRDEDGEEDDEEDEEEDDDDEEYDDDDEDDQPQSGDDSKRGELVEHVLSLPFSATRDAFLKRATAVLEMIEDATAPPADGDDTESDAPKVKAEASLASKNSVLPKIRNTLAKREKRIGKGLDYAVSAKVLVEAVTKNGGAKVHETLQRLVIGTLHYGKVSSVQLYQILTAIIPELSNVVEVDPQTCPSPWADICPPQDLERDGRRIPSTALVESVQAFCANLSVDASTAMCAEAEVDSEATIPTEVPDGYYGYFESQPRDESDLLSQAFAGLGLPTSGDEEAAKTKLAEMQTTVDDANTEVSELEREISDMEDDENNPDKFGPDGELHSIREKCFSVTAGKYEYSVCMFGEATQKADGSSTDLGSWNGADSDTLTDSKGVEYQQRIWKWENGAQCWNGPQRSATGYVTCGAATRVLSADEPDTCRYVLQMESPLACDEDFRARHGL